jgi:hypothetical protein
MFTAISLYLWDLGSVEAAAASLRPQVVPEVPHWGAMVLAVQVVSLHLQVKLHREEV